MYNVFLSYLRDDKSQAIRLAKELQSNGAVVWVDVSDLTIGATWREEIAQAIRRAEFFVACFSSTNEERPDNGMLDELKYAISLRTGQEYPEILPVKLNECDIPDLQIDRDKTLKELHWYLLDDQNWHAGVRQLVEITLKMAKERAKIRLKNEAEEVAVKNSEMVQAREELRTHEVSTLRMQRIREMNRQNTREWSKPELPSAWPAQNAARKEVEYQYAWAQYDKHQREYVRRFGEEYHPLGELTPRMGEEKKRIHQSGVNKREAEAASIAGAQKEVLVFIILIAIVVTVLYLIWVWLKSLLGF